MSGFSESERRQVLIRLRQRLRIPAIELATAVKVHNSTLSLWENGHVSLAEDKLTAIEDYLAGELAALKLIQHDRGRAPQCATT